MSYDTLRRRHLPHLGRLSGYSGPDNGGSDDEFEVDSSIPSTPFELNDSDQRDRPDMSWRDSTDASPNIYKVPGDQSFKDYDTAPKVDHDVDDRQCRICFAGADEEDALGRMISPCLCMGSMRYVHMQCLNAWRGTGTNAKAFMECPQCHHQYHFRRTLAAGLATSQPLLMLFSTIFFGLLTLITGSALFYLLSRSSSTRRTLLATSTIFETEAQMSIQDTWTSDYANTVFVVGYGSLFDIVIGAIQTFTRIALEFSEWAEESLSDGYFSGLVFNLGVRFILGLAVMGSFSFITLIFSVSLFGPFHMFNTVRGLGLFRNWARRDNGNARGGRGNIGQAMIILFVMIGTLNTLWSVYRMMHRVTQRMLIWMEAQILEVNPDERQKERERQERRRREGYLMRWVRLGRWKEFWGWWELVVRLCYAAWDGVKERWRKTKEGWSRGIAIFDDQ